MAKAGHKQVTQTRETSETVSCFHYFAIHHVLHHFLLFINNSTFQNNSQNTIKNVLDKNIALCVESNLGSITVKNG